MVPLTLAEPNSTVEVMDFHCGRNCAFRLQEMGIVKGAQYRVTNGSGNGPLILADGENRIGLGFGMAAKVMIREIVDA